MFLHSSCHPKLLNSSTGVFIDTLVKSVVKESTSSRIPLESPDLLARLACSTACGTASGRGLGGIRCGLPYRDNEGAKKIPGLMRISRILVTFLHYAGGILVHVVFSGLTVCNTFCDLLSSHQLRYVNSSPFGSCFQFFQIALNTLKFKLQALWPLKGWFEFTATGRDAVSSRGRRG